MSKNTEDYIWALQDIYALLNADTMKGGALALLPAGGDECEAKVAKAVEIARECLGEDLQR